MLQKTWCLETDTTSSESESPKAEEMINVRSNYSGLKLFRDISWIVLASDIHVHVDNDRNSLVIAGS